MVVDPEKKRAPQSPLAVLTGDFSCAFYPALLMATPIVKHTSTLNVHANIKLSGNHDIKYPRRRMEKAFTTVVGKLLKQT